LTSKPRDLRREIINYVQEEIKRNGSIPTRYKICKKFRISRSRLYRLIFGSRDVEGKDECDFFRAMKIQILSPASINAVIRSMQKRLRSQILRRDGHKCIVCGSTIRLELAHIYPCPISGESRISFVSKGQVERTALPYYAPENLMILCRRCHMLFDIKDLTRKFLRHRDRKESLEMSVKVLIDAGIKLSELKSGGVENVQRGVYHYMHKLYGENYYERLCQIINAFKRKVWRKI